MDKKNLDPVNLEAPPSVVLQSDNFVPKKTPQYLAALAGTLGAFGLGNVLGWSSGGMTSMEESGDFGDFKENSEIASWVASICTLGCLTASLTLGFVVELIGRKWTMLTLAVPFFAGWLLIGFATNIPMLLVGRFVTGFCGGGFTLVHPIYVGEIAENHIRGILSNIMNVILTSGILFVYVVSAGLAWDKTCFACAAFPVILFVAMFFVPESPRYLIAKGREDEARISLRRLRGADTNSQIETELNLIHKSVQEAQGRSVSLRDLVQSGPILKPTLICMVLMLLQQMGGIKLVLFYSEPIFKAAKTDLPADVQAISIAAVQVLFVIVSTLLVERLGRKILLVVSDAGMGISLAVLGAFFYLQEHEPETAANLGWLPLVSLISFTITYNLGLGPLPWTVMGELVPPQIKGLAGSLASGVCWGLGFVITKTFHNLTDAMHPYGLYWLFSACSLTGTIFCLLVVPETKGRSLDEIQAIFASDGKSKKLKNEVTNP